MTETTEQNNHTTQIVATEKERTKDSYIHGFIILAVLASATALRLHADLDTATVSTVYGAVIGYAGGLSMKQRNGIK